MTSVVLSVWLGDSLADLLTPLPSNTADSVDYMYTNGRRPTSPTHVHRRGGLGGECRHSRRSQTKRARRSIMLMRS